MNILIIIIVLFWVATTVTVMAEMAPQVREDLNFWQEIMFLITLTIGAPFMLITQAIEQILQNFTREDQDNDKFGC